MWFYTQSTSTVILGQKRTRKLTSLMDCLFLFLNYYKLRVFFCFFLIHTFFKAASLTNKTTCGGITEWPTPGLQWPCEKFTWSEYIFYKVRLDSVIQFRPLYTMETIARV